MLFESPFSRCDLWSWLCFWMVAQVICGKIGSEPIATWNDLIWERILKMDLTLSELRDNGSGLGVLLTDLRLGKKCGLLPMIISYSESEKEKWMLLMNAQAALPLILCLKIHPQRSRHMLAPWCEGALSLPPSLSLSLSLSPVFLAIPI